MFSVSSRQRSWVLLQQLATGGKLPEKWHYQMNKFNNLRKNLSYPHAAGSPIGNNLIVWSHRARGWYIYIRQNYFYINVSLNGCCRCKLLFLTIHTVFLLAMAENVLTNLMAFQIITSYSDRIGQVRSARYKVTQLIRLTQWLTYPH